MLHSVIYVAAEQARGERTSAGASTTLFALDLGLETCAQTRKWRSGTSTPANH